MTWGLGEVAVQSPVAPNVLDLQMLVASIFTSTFRRGVK